MSNQGKNEAGLTPPLKWAGGKRWLVPRLKEIAESNLAKRLIEPFAGGLSITLGLSPKEALVNDINPYVMNFYKQIHDGLDISQVLQSGLGNQIHLRWAKQADLIFAAEKKRLQTKAQKDKEKGLAFASDKDIDNLIAKGKDNTFKFIQTDKQDRLVNEKVYFYTARSLFNELIKTDKKLSPETAVLFYYMNRTAFNGLCRFNSKGEFNVPFGSYKTINYKNSFPELEKALKAWEFKVGDFYNLDVDPQNDWIYADPPYDVPFTSYSEEGFSWEDQERLIKWLDNFNCPVVLSNQATERIVELYKNYGYHVFLIPVKRNISANGQGRGPVNEVLAFRNIPSNLFPTDLEKA